MSYDKAQSFSMNFEDYKIKANLACSNIYPLTYFPSVIDLSGSVITADAVKKGLMTKKQVFTSLTLHHLLSGNIRLYRSVYYKYRHALLKVKQQLMNDGLTFQDFYNRDHEIVGRTLKDDEEYENVVGFIKKYTDIFIHFLEMSPTKGEFIIEGKSEFIKKVNNATYRFVYYRENAKKYKTFEEAELELEILPSGFSILSY